MLLHSDDCFPPLPPPEMTTPRKAKIELFFSFFYPNQHNTTKKEEILFLTSVPKVFKAFLSFLLLRNLSHPSLPIIRITIPSAKRARSVGLFPSACRISFHGQRNQKEKPSSSIGLGFSTAVGQCRFLPAFETNFSIKRASHGPYLPTMVFYLFSSKFRLNLSWSFLVRRMTIILS